VLPEIESVMADMGMKQQRLRYAGRPAAASPATGLLRRHLKEQAALVEEALVVEQPAQRAAQ
jgi:2-oxoglutarate dehydrogenase E1 component